MRRGSIRLRLTLAAGLSVLLAIGLAAAALTVLFERHVERRVTAELTVHLDQLVAGLARDAEGRLTLTQAPADPRFTRPLSGLYWQITETSDDGTVDRLRSRSLWDALLDLPADALADGAVHQHRVAGPADATLLAVERRVRLPSRLGGGTVRAVVAVDRAEVTAATRGFQADLAPYVASLAGLLIAASWLQIVIGLRPLSRVSARLAAIRSGAASRLGAAFPSEVQPLAAEVDQLLEAREAQLARARARAGDLAHGLKTPLQVLSADVDRLRDAGARDIADQLAAVADSMRAIVDRELARARLAADGPHHASTPLAPALQRVIAVVQRTPTGAPLRWEVDVPAACQARIDPTDLTEAIGNLLDNAGRHARSRVRVSADDRDGRLRLGIADDGPGLSRAERQRVLERGVSGSADGAGLGLAIARDIAEAWGGALSLEDGLTWADGASAGHGLAAVLTLPVPPAAHAAPPPL